MVPIQNLARSKTWSTNLVSIKVKRPCTEGITIFEKQDERNFEHLFGTSRSLIGRVEVQNKRPANKLRQLHITTILILQNEWR